MSARTGGYILLQLLFDLSRPGGQADRVLNGPTNDVWIDPWLAHLRSLGVDFRFEHQVQAIHCADGRISGVSVVAGGNDHRGKRRLLRRRIAGRGHAAPGQRRAEGGRAAAGRPAPPAHPLDERDHVLPRPRPAPRPRTHRLHRLALGPHVDLASSVLARRRAGGDGRRASGGDPLRRRLRLGGARHRPRQAGDVLLEGGGPRRGLGPARGRARGRRHRRPPGGERHRPGSSIRRSSTPTRRRR